jgi:hypothetical protein
MVMDSALCILPRDDHETESSPTCSRLKDSTSISRIAKAIQFFSSAHWNSPPQGITTPKTPQTHAIHYADANEAELVVNQQFLIRIESIFGPQPSYDLTFAVNILKNFIFEARKLQQLHLRGEIYNTSNLLFTVRDLL